MFIAALRRFDLFRFDSRQRVFRQVYDQFLIARSLRIRRYWNKLKLIEAFMKLLRSAIWFSINGRRRE